MQGGNESHVMYFAVIVNMRNWVRGLKIYTSETISLPKIKCLVADLLEILTHNNAYQTSIVFHFLNVQQSMPYRWLEMQEMS